MNGRIPMVDPNTMGLDEEAAPVITSGWWGRPNGRIKLPSNINWPKLLELRIKVLGA